MRLIKLVPSARIQGRWLCHLEDGSILRVSENEVLHFALYSGMELSQETAQALAAAAEHSRLREKALSLISARPMSRKELLKKLTARKRPLPQEDGFVGREEEEEDVASAARDVCDWLEDLGYLNDAEYAKTVARHYSAKGYGPGKIRDELWKRGVPREFWDGAEEETDSAEAGIDAFLRQKLKGTRPDPSTLKKVSDALARRGYRWSDIKDGLRRYGADIGEESV